MINRLIKFMEYLESKENNGFSFIIEYMPNNDFFETVEKQVCNELSNGYIDSIESILNSKHDNGDEYISEKEIELAKQCIKLNKLIKVEINTSSLGHYTFWHHNLDEIKKDIQEMRDILKEIKW